MAAEFTTISREEMEEWLTKHWTNTWTTAVDRPRSEVVYDIPTTIPGVVYRLYSSVVSGSGVSRGVGEDAIRFVLFDQWSRKALGKTKRVHRTEGATTVWERMLGRIEELAQHLVSINFCPKCGYSMILREPDPRKGQTWKPFYGCSQFPDCRGTRRGMTNGEGINKRIELAMEMPDEPEERPRLKRREAPSTDDGGDRVEQATIFDGAGDAGSGQDGAAEVPTEFISTKAFPHIEYPFESFQPIQGALAKELVKGDWDSNIICAAPTGAGKTVLAEMAIIMAIKNGAKAVYAAPFKALSQEKLGEWKERFKGYNISIVTGDYTLTQKRVKELREADIIIVTTEMLDSRTRRMEAERNDWLLGVEVVVVDEFHIITMKDRGDKVESGLMRFCAINPRAKIVGISATMPNVDELAAWLTKINNKPTTLLKSNWRPVNLNVHPVPYSGSTYWAKEDAKMALTLRIIDEYPEDKFMVFVHAKKSGYALLRALEEKGITADFHSADLDLEKRLDIEAKFKDRENGIRILVSTSTTAWGVNMPARRCIIFGVTRGLAPVDVMDIIQEIGRSGRPGLDPEGDAYILCPESDLDPLGGPNFWGNIVQHCPPIKSQMLDHHVLGFHICAELGGKPMGIYKIKEWYSRSLAAHQGMDLEDYLIDNLMAELVEIGCVEFDVKWNTYKLTGLGRVSAWLYYDPWSVSAWHKNFGWFFGAENEIQPHWKDEAMAVCLANIPAYEMEYVPRDFEMRVNGLANRYGRFIQPFRAGSGVMMLAAADMMVAGEVANGLNVFFRQISWDMMRITQALKLIDSHYGKWGRQRFFEVLGLRVRYGVPADIVELVEIQGIGAARAKKLASRGIKNLRDFAENTKKARNVLGSAVFKKAHASVKKLLEEKEV